mgnify:CR=1 FL=1
MVAFVLTKKNDEKIELQAADLPALQEKLSAFFFDTHQVDFKQAGGLFLNALGYKSGALIH